MRLGHLLVKNGGWRCFVSVVNCFGYALSTHLAPSIFAGATGQSHSSDGLRDASYGAITVG